MIRTWRRLFHRFTQEFEGWPDHALTVALVLAALVLVLIAFKAKPWEKAVALAYVVLP